MSVRYQISKADLTREFVYRGWFLGLVPVYVGELRQGMPVIATRNWVPDILLDLAEGLFGGFVTVASVVAPDFYPTYPLLITSRIDGKSLAEDEL